jgi:hypothetical protein
VLGPMAGRMDCLDLHLAQPQDPTVGEGLVTVLSVGKLVDVNRGAGRLGEPAVTGNMISVIMGLQHMLDSHAVQSRQPPIRANVPLRIDYGGNPGFAVGNKIGGASEILVDYLAKEHGMATVGGIRLQPGLRDASAS